MPPVIASVAAAAIGAAIAKTSIIVAVVGALVSSALSMAAGALLKKKPPKQKSPDLVSEGRTQMVRQPITVRRRGYGMVKLSGPITFLHARPAAAGGTRNDYLHLVIPLAGLGRAIAEIGEIWLNDELCELDASGNAVNAPFKAGSTIHVHVDRHLGAADQAANATLLADAPNKWTAEHRLRGVAYLHVRLYYGTDEQGQKVFHAGVPDIRAICRLASVYDPRDPAQDVNDPASWAWTDNAALCIADYLRTPKLDGGLGVPVTGIDWATVAAAADVCDEIVPRRATEIACDVDEDGLVHLAEPHCVTGTRVRVATDGALPGGLDANTDYYWIATGTGRGRLAASLADARAGRAVEILHTGAGDHRITVTGEPRYTCNGTFDTDEKPADILAKLLTSMAGTAVPPGPAWKLYAGAWNPPTRPAIDEDDLRDMLTVATALPRREACNGVRGTFFAPQRAWQPTDFPPVEVAAYRAEDDGEELWLDLDLPFTNSPAMCQRIARIELEKRRREVTVQWPGKLTLLGVGTHEVVPIDNARFGWQAKSFRVTKWALNEALGVDLDLREEDAGVYDWSAESDERPFAPVPAGVIAGPGSAEVAPPTNVVAVGGVDGAAGPRIRVVWTRSPTSGVSSYQIEFWQQADGGTNRTSVTASGAANDAFLTGVVADIPYMGRIRAATARGASGWASFGPVTAAQETAPPAAPTGVSARTGSKLGRIDLSWTNPGDADFWRTWVYRSQGGPETVIARISGLAGGSHRNWTDTGLANGAVYYYRLRAEDLSGNLSEFSPTVGAQTIYYDPGSGGGE